MRCLLWLNIALLMLTLPVSANAWDLFYDGSTLPNAPSLGTNAWSWSGDLSMCTTDGTNLRIVDNDPVKAIGFWRSAAAAGESLTVEARVRVVGGDSTKLYLGTPSYTPYFQLYSDRIVAHLDYTTLTYTADLSSFRTIRVATLSDNGVYRSFLWIDSVLAGQGRAYPGGNQFDLMFGSFWGNTGESYWDYVAYSNEFLPVPEPSSLAALTLALFSAAGAAVARRRRG